MLLSTLVAFGLASVVESSAHALDSSLHHTFGWKLQIVGVVRRVPGYSRIE